MFKRMMAWLLCLVMLFAALPMAAFATDDVAQETVAEEIVAEAAEVTEEATEEVTEEVAEEATEEVAEEATEATPAETVVEEETVAEVSVEEAEDIAEESATQEPAAAVQNYILDEYGCYRVYNFVGLKEVAQLLPDTDDEYYDVLCDVGGTLTIESSIKIPRSMHITVWEGEKGPGEIVIPAGVTLTLNGSLSVQNITVNGTLKNNGLLDLTHSLVITGEIKLYQSIGVRSFTKITGAEKIYFESEEAEIVVGYYEATLSNLDAILNEATAMAPHWRAYISVYLENDGTLTKSIEVPEKCMLEFSGEGTLTIAKECVLTHNGNTLNISSDVIVNGTLVNNGCINQYVQETNNEITFGSTGMYSGYGKWYIYVNDTKAQPYEDYIKGLNFEEFFVEDGGECWYLRNKAGLTKLAAPTDLMWGKVYERNDDWTEMVLKNVPGGMAWGVSEPSQNYYYVCLYKEDGTLVNEGWYYAGVQDGNKWCSSDMFVANPPESGNYYFTVQAVTEGDSDEYVNSDIVYSDIYTYVRPTKKLSKPTNVKLVEPKGQENAYLVASFQAKKGDYEVEWYVSKSKDEEPSLAASCPYTAYQDGEQRDSIGKGFMNDYSGYYFYVRVRAISDNIETAVGSDWTALCTPVKYVKKVVKKLSAPTGLKTYKEYYSGKPIIMWNAVKDADSYDVYRSTKKTSGYKKINKEPVYDIGYYDESAKVGTTYYYKVKAVNGKVVSGYSSYKSGACATGAPTISSANTASTGKVKLSWAKVDKAEKYYIYRSTKKTSGFEKIGSTTKAYYTDSDAKIGTTYYYKVKAVVDGITSEYSNTISDKRVCARPSLTVKIASTGKPKLSWDKVSGAKQYRISYATYDPATGEYGAVTTITTTSTSYTHKKAVVGQTYAYVVEVLGSKSGTNSAPSDEKHATCVLGAPEIEVKADSKSGKPVITWDENEDVHWYRVYRSTKSSSGFTIVGGGFGYNEKFVDNTATAGKKYYYKVVPVSYELKTGVASEVVSCYADCAKPVVEGSLSSKKPKLTWEKVSGAQKYEVYRSTKSSSGFKKIKTVSGTSYTDKSATTGKTYYYKVKAIAPKSSANSVYSSVIKITKSTKAKTISGNWKLDGLAPGGEEMDKITLSFNKGNVSLRASYYSAVPKEQVQSVLETGVINSGEGYLYCNDLCKFDGAYYYSMSFGGYAPGTYTENGSTVVVTIGGENAGTMTLKKVSPGKYKVTDITGVIYDEIVTEVIRGTGVFTYAP